VTYRFAQPNEAVAAILTLEHYLTNRTWLPEKLETVGDYIRRRRLTLKLLQRQVAQQLNVSAATVTNWEANARQPGVKYMPAIIRFLGYNPLPPRSQGGWAERLVRCRTRAGVFAEGVREAIGRGPGHLARWEREEREPTGTFKVRVLRFMNSAEATWAGDAARTA
jgi:transcriptional regulator with XRE-family HTH domain